MATCPKTSKMGKGRSTLPYGTKASWRAPGGRKGKVGTPGEPKGIAKIKALPFKRSMGKSSKARSGRAVGRKTSTVDRMAPYRISDRVRRDPRGMSEGPWARALSRQPRRMSGIRSARRMIPFLGF